MAEKKPVLITDLDGTFIRTSMHEMLMHRLFELGIFSQELAKRYFYFKERWKNREEHDSFVQFERSSVDIMVNNLAGNDFKKIKSISDEIIDSSWNYTYVFPRWLYYEAKIAGYSIGAISHSPDFMVERFSQKHEFDFWSGSRYEVDNEGKFTKNITTTDKKITVRKLVKKSDNYTIDGSIALGDTMSDVPMFEASYFPICFNPTLALAKEAKKKNWIIVQERKDTIMVNGEIFDKNMSWVMFVEKFFYQH
ncbi:MAG: HAD-IB family phosphatase [Candidatus Paceibacterota bacterium]